MGITDLNQCNICNTKELVVYFVTDKIILLSPNKNNARFELDRKGVNAIHWCDKTMIQSPIL
jgi:hypothetical protein